MVQTTRCIFFLLSFVAVGHAHMQMKNPPPRRSPHNPYAIAQHDTDTDLSKPLSSDGTNFPCKSYQAGGVVQSYKAGDNIQVQMDGSAIHGGGHCQFSISYNDHDFVSIHTVIHDCFIGTGMQFSVKLPENAPACSRCTFSWSWVNAVGNREFYMNCADIRIINDNVNHTTLSGPRMTVANLPGYPRIAEWPPATTDGSVIYRNPELITITTTGESLQYNGTVSDVDMKHVYQTQSQESSKVGDINTETAGYPSSQLSESESVAGDDHQEDDDEDGENRDEKNDGDDCKKNDNDRNDEVYAITSVNDSSALKFVHSIWATAAAYCVFLIQ